jgi:tetratricopeptide (TPR) repeat protein
VAAADRYMEKAPKKNDWYYTLLGATWGIQGIYFLRRDEYASGAYYGVKGLYYMQTAEQMNEKNYEARLGIGLYLYYRSAYSRFIPIPWLDQRAEGIKMVKEAGEHRPYLSEVSKIALFYIYNNEKDYDTAFKYIHELIGVRPDFPIFYHFAGRALMNKGDFQDAEGYYLRMSRIDPTLYFPYFQLGVCELNLGHKAEAQKWFEKFFAVLGGRQSVHRAPAEKYIKQLQ